MRNSALFRGVLATLILTTAFFASTRNAQAIPIFAQRYHLQCKVCHTALPELNAFGTAFRDRGYQLPLPKHGTTVLALRYQNEYEETPPAGQERFSPGGVVLGNADIGRVSAFVHYNLGAGGGPAGLYLGYLATYNEHTRTLYRAGLFELPLAQSPGQRLDDLQGYGYYGALVGENDLTLGAPRWGGQAERTVGVSRIGATIDFGEYKGNVYGGKPVNTGENTSAAAPEFGLWYRTPLFTNVDVGATYLSGVRSITEDGAPAPFDDAYNREGLLFHAKFLKNFDFQSEQWYGHDNNADNTGAVGSSGGYTRLKYYIDPHAYVGIRYDASATPTIARDVVYYTGFAILPSARLVIQEVHTVGQPSHFGGAITLGLPPLFGH